MFTLGCISVVSNRLVAATRGAHNALVSQGKIKVHEAENLGMHANIAGWVNLDWHSTLVTAVLGL